MKFTFLGTSAGKPTKDRNLSAIALEMEQSKQWYLFDCGEGTQYRIMDVPFTLSKLSTIFITHLHGDHCFGLPGLLASRNMDGITTPLKIYGPAGLKDFVSGFMKPTKLNLGYEIEVIEIPDVGEEFFFDLFDIKVVPLEHSIHSFAYCINEHRYDGRLDEQALKKIGIKPGAIYAEIKKGKKITLEDGTHIDGGKFLKDAKEGRRVIVSGDNFNPRVLGENLKDVDLLIHEATYTDEVFESMKVKVKHTTAKKLAICAEDYGVKNLIATHISPRYSANPSKNQLDIEFLGDEIKEFYSGNSFIANDLDVFHFDKNGKLSLVQNYRRDG